MSTRNEALIAQNHWETKWITAEGTFDPAYERTNQALRRWVDGMEAALLKSTPRQAQPAGKAR